MTSTNIRAPFLHYVKLCAPFQIHRWIRTGVTVRKRSIRVKIGDFASSVTLKFHGWPWKTIGHLFYATSKPRCIQTGVERETLNLVKDGKFPVTVKFDKWPWKTIGYLFYITSSFVHHFKAMGAFKLALQSGNAQLGTKWAIFVLCDLKFDGWHWKTIGQIFRAASSFVHHSIAISKF